MIEFISSDGEIVKSVTGLSASHILEEAYLQVKVNRWVEKVDGFIRKYSAWTQPVLTDGR